MSKFGDAVRGLYFRKSKQAGLEQSIARIEAAQQKSAQAIAGIEAALQYPNKQLHVETEPTRIKPPAPIAGTVEEALDAAISRSATTLDSHAQNAEVYRRWYEGMEFTDDWTSDNFGIWSQVFDAHGKSFTQGLEIGSFEGRSAISFLEYLPNLRLTCLDLFEHTSEFFAKRKPWVKFDKNLSKYAGRYEKVISPSANALAEFASKGRKFDFIYIDGSHTRDDVFVDALLSWKLLNVNGVLIFDDYFWGWHYKSSERPK